MNSDCISLCILKVTFTRLLMVDECSFALPAEGSLVHLAIVQMTATRINNAYGSTILYYS